MAKSATDFKTFLLLGQKVERAMGIETIPVVATVSIDVANDDNYSITENTSLYV
jgi:hypothetical protein